MSTVFSRADIDRFISFLWVTFLVSPTKCWMLGDHVSGAAFHDTFFETFWVTCSPLFFFGAIEKDEKRVMIDGNLENVKCFAIMYWFMAKADYQFHLKTNFILDDLFEDLADLKVEHVRVLNWTKGFLTCNDEAKISYGPWPKFHTWQSFKHLPFFRSDSF